jgi:Nucleoside 2-deoxyribosyltransferase
MNSKIKKIYLASPLGFSEVGRDFYSTRLISVIKKLGYQVLDPWGLTPVDKIEKVRAMRYGVKKRDAWKRLNTEIGESNKNAIDESDGIVAVLDGTDVDSGTAAEIGYGFAKGKPIFGYRGDFRLSADNEGGIVNLQVEYFIRASGGTIITEIDKLHGELKRIFG